MTVQCFDPVARAAFVFTVPGIEECARPARSFHDPSSRALVGEGGTATLTQAALDEADQ